MSVMDSNSTLMTSSTRAVRPGSQSWWAMKEGEFLFSRKRVIDSKRMGKAILVAMAMGAAVIGGFWWLTNTFLP